MNSKGRWNDLGIQSPRKRSVTWRGAIVKGEEQNVSQHSGKAGTRKTGTGAGEANKVKNRPSVLTAQKGCLLTYYKMPTFPTQPPRVNAK